MTQRSQPDTDDADLIERVAKAMWNWSHDGSWEDVEFCVSEETRRIYLTDAEIAVKLVRSTIPSAHRGTTGDQNV
jgi:hypothetical protein